MIMSHLFICMNFIRFHKYYIDVLSTKDIHLSIFYFIVDCVALWLNESSMKILLCNFCALFVH